MRMKTWNIFKKSEKPKHVVEVVFELTPITSFSNSVTYRE